MSSNVQCSEKVWNPSKETAQIVRKEHVTAQDVREVISECFSQAHGDPVQAKYILRNQFHEAGVSWEAPTKKDLERIIPRLEKVAVRFRNPEIISRNKMKVKGLLRKCCEK